MENTLIKIDGTLGFGKDAHKALVENWSAQVDDNMVDPLKMLAQVTCIKKACEDTISHIMEQALREAEKYPEKSFTKYGVKLEKKEVGVKYDYSEDGIWVSINEQLKAIKAELSGRETVLKKTGECGKSSTSTVAVTLL